MITKENVSSLLGALKFEKEAGIHRKFINGVRLEVDTTKGIISYPVEDGLTVNEKQTCNFEANENFVVLECVHRLLLQGYKPEHIELEPKWRLGHGSSGGRADILVKDNDGRPLLLIECKTPGLEMKRA